MADARIDETVYVDMFDLHKDVVEHFGSVGVVIYSKSFNVNGVQIWMVPQ